MSTPIIMNSLDVPRSGTPHFLVPYALHLHSARSDLSTQLLCSHPKLAQEPPTTGLSYLFLWSSEGSHKTLCTLLSKHKLPILCCLVSNLTMWIVFSARILLHSLLASNLSSCRSFYLECLPAQPQLTSKFHPGVIWNRNIPHPPEWAKSAPHVPLSLCIGLSHAAFTLSVQLSGSSSKAEAVPDSFP